MENTSGQGKEAVVPEEVKGLAWGAFLWTWLWGIFNRTWLALLTIVPIVGLVMWVMLLFKGREWAWRNKSWDSVEHFNRVQRKWAKAGVIVLLVFPVLGIAAAIIIPMLADNEAPAPAIVRQAAPAKAGPAPSPAAVPAPAAPVVPAQATAPVAPEEHSLAPEVEADSSDERKADKSPDRMSKKNTGSRLPADVEAMEPLPEPDSEPVVMAEPEESVMPPRNVITPRFNDLMTAVMFQDRAAAEQLLDIGWWVDKTDSHGVTPLMEAVILGDAPMAELLLKHGANPNAVAHGNSALQLARNNRDTAMEALLRRYGATE